MHTTGFAPRQRQLGRGQLQQWVAAEGRILTQVPDECPEVCAQRLVKRAHGVVIERHRRQPNAVDAAPKVRLQSKTLAIGLVRSRGPFEVHEVLDHGLAEGRQLDHDAGRKIARIERKVPASEARRAAQSGGDVPDRCQMTHLFDGHVQDHAPPTSDGDGFARAQASASPLRRLNAAYR